MEIKFENNPELNYSFQVQATQKSAEGLVVYGTATSPTLDLDNEMILFHPRWFNDVAKEEFLEGKNVYNADSPGRMVWNHGRDFEFEDVANEAEYSDRMFYPESKVIGQVLSLDYQPNDKTKKFDIDNDESMDYYFKHAKVEAVFMITDQEMISRFDKQQTGVSISWYPIDPDKTRRYIGSGANNVNKFIEREFYMREISLTANPANTDTFDLAEATPDVAAKFEEPSESSGYQIDDLVEYAEMRAEVVSKRVEHGINYYTLKFADATMKSHREFTDEQLTPVKMDYEECEEGEDCDNDKNADVIEDFKRAFAEQFDAERVEIEMAGFVYFYKGEERFMTDFFAMDVDGEVQFEVSEPLSFDDLQEPDMTENDVKSKAQKMLRTTYDSDSFDSILREAINRKLEIDGLEVNGLNELRYETPRFKVGWTDTEGEKHTVDLKFDSENQVTFFGKPTNIGNLEKGFTPNIKFANAPNKSDDK